MIAIKLNWKIEEFKKFKKILNEKKRKIQFVIF